MQVNFIVGLNEAHQQFVRTQVASTPPAELEAWLNDHPLKWQVGYLSKSAYDS